MHVISQCRHCARQYQTDDNFPGDQFHCLCGEILVVATPKDDIASVVSCSTCGGSRHGSSEKCSYCGSDFTLHEQDLNTICPNCLSRISDKGRYCHHCATPIVISSYIGEITTHPCPRCSSDRLLTSRRLDDDNLNLLECNVCAGVWLDNDVFLRLEQRTTDIAASGITDHHKRIEKQLQQNPSNKNQMELARSNDQNLYRKCPRCETMMHRRNYGPGSGIILDQCHQHGFWFDREELDLILRWIKTGGLLKGRARRKKIQRQQDRVSKLLGEIEQKQNRFNKSLVDYYLGTN